VNAVQFRRLLVRRGRRATEGPGGERDCRPLPQVGARRRLDGFNFLGPVRNNIGPAGGRGGLARAGWAARWKPGTAWRAHPADGGVCRTQMV